MSVWEYCNLEAAVKKATSNLSLNKIANEEGEYPVFGAKGFVSNISYYHQEEEYLAIIKDGAGIGRVSKHPGKSSILATMQYLVPNEAFDIDFIKYFLMSVDFQEYRTGSTIPHIYFKDYKSLRLPNIPIPEQQRIVAILDQAFADIEKARANAEKNLKNARELFDSYLNQVFSQRGEGWVEKSLGETCIFQGGSQPPKSEFSIDQKPGYIRLIQIRDYKSDKRAVYIPRVKSKRYCLADDVMIGRYGPPLFQILRGIEGSYNVALIKVSPKDGLITKDYLYYFLRNRDILKYIIDSSSRAAGQIGLNKKTIEPYPIGFPPIEEQIKICAQLKDLAIKTTHLESISKEKLNSLDELKKSLLQKAFSGELTKTEGMVA